MAVRDPAGRREAAAADEPGADRPVERAELLPPQRARPAAGLGQRPGRSATSSAWPPSSPSWPAAASGSGSSARRSSSGWAARRSTRPGRSRAACGAPLTEEAARPDPRPGPRGDADHRARHRPVQGAARRLRGGGRPSATSPRCSWGWSAPDGEWEHYDGRLRFVDGEGAIVADGLDPRAVSRSTSARRSSRART